jgi:hypothetical protein
VGVAGGGGAFVGYGVGEGAGVAGEVEEILAAGLADLVAVGVAVQGDMTRDVPGGAVATRGAGPCVTAEQGDGSADLSIAGKL